MARLWEDGFDHYGGDTSNMLDGSYATAGAITLSNALVADGSSYSIYIHASDSQISTNEALRWVLPSAETKLGVQARFYFPDAPNNNTRAAIVDFMTSSSTKSHICVFADSNGALRFYRGNFYGFPAAGLGTQIAVTDPILTMAAFNHVEIQVNIDSTAGWIRVAVNGVHRFEQTGLNTRYNTDNVVSIMHHIMFNSDAQTTQNDFYMRDLVYYNFTGDSAVDTDYCPSTDAGGIATGYIGDLIVWPLYANGDTAQADWAKSSGTDGYALINEHSPDDAGYILSTAADDLSEFDMDDLPERITYIRGLGLHQRLSKSDGGACMTKVGMKSVSATSDAAERPLTVIPTYWRDAIDVDPNSSARWTRDSLNAAWYRQIRSL